MVIGVVFVRHWDGLTRKGRTSYYSETAQMLGWTAPRHRVPGLGCHQPRPEPSMSEIKRIGIDTSKAVFPLHAVDEAGTAILILIFPRLAGALSHLQGHSGGRQRLAAVTTGLAAAWQKPA
jgi:hypothetical protein